VVTHIAAITSSSSTSTAAWAPHVVDIDERGAAVKWLHSADSKIVRPTVVVGDLVSRRNQSAQGATPLPCYPLDIRTRHLFLSRAHRRTCCSSSIRARAFSMIMSKKSRKGNVFGRVRQRHMARIRAPISTRMPCDGERLLFASSPTDGQDCVSNNESIE